MTRDHDATIRAAIDSGRMMIVPVGDDLARRTAAAAASPPCPDCGQGWPDGCAFDCPSRDE